jgi:hypothetical protein
MEQESAVDRPGIPVALLLIVLLGIWLGILGPLPTGFAAWLQSWQTLLAATVASVAAYIAFQNTSRTLAHAESLETNRRKRKHAAVRAVLPIALSQVNGYAEKPAKALSALVEKCEGDELPVGSAKDSLIEPLPPETLKILADFIEFTDAGNLEVLESTLARIQIHDARLRGLLKRTTIRR